MDAQPDHRIEYTERLDVAKINRIPRFRLTRGCGMGSGIHRLSASDRDSAGARTNRVVEVARGRRGSLMNNFMASANGWRIP